jgi:flagellar motility protein MotE (MotC chaperone)
MGPQRAAELLTEMHPHRVVERLEAMDRQRATRIQAEMNL